MTENPWCVLRFDYRIAEDKTVTSVLAERMNDAPAMVVRIAIVMGDDVLSIAVDPDTDQVFVEFGPMPAADEDASWAPIHELDDMVGRQIGWCRRPAYRDRLRFRKFCR
jgi:hypothetical protein